MQRTSSSPLSVGNAAWQPNSCYSFEEFNGESSSGKIICMDYIAWFHYFLIPLKDTISNWLATAFTQSPTEHETKSRACPSTQQVEQDRICSSPTRLCLILVELKKRHLGKRTVVSCLEEQHNAKHCFLHLYSADFQWWEEVVPLRNLLKTRQLTLFFKIKLKITGLFLTDPYSSLLNDTESMFMSLTWQLPYEFLA